MAVFLVLKKGEIFTGGKNRKKSKTEKQNMAKMCISHRQGLHHTYLKCLMACGTVTGTEPTLSKEILC